MHEEETENQHNVIVTQKCLFKDFTAKGFEITTKSSSISVTVTMDGAVDLTVRNLPQREEFHATPRSSLPNYF